MNILIPNWKSFCVEDIQETLEKMGHSVTMYTEEPKNYRIDPKYKSTLKKYVRENDVDLIFSCNFSPVISDACNDLNIIYIAWCYDSPLILTYSKTIFNPCNRVFIFDSKMVQDLKNIGVENVYYMPMAVNTERIDKLHATSEQKKIIDADVSFVGSLYTEKHTLYDRMTKLDEYTKGYLEGVMSAQHLIYGASIIEETLNQEIIGNMLAAMPIQTNNGGLETTAYTYANYFLARKITQTERTEMLQAVGTALHSMTLSSGKSASPLKLYTPEATPFLKYVKNMGTVQYFNEMPLVFRHSKINLNITLRSIVNGIPLRAMDIMGAGGFLLTNYQNDFNLHFVEGEDYVCYENVDDMLDKIKYYLNNENERNTIAENAHKKICHQHNYDIRLREIFDIALG